MTRPETLLTFSDYKEDFKVRVQIHNYEVKKLREDLTLLFNYLTDKTYYKATNQWIVTPSIDFGWWRVYYCNIENHTYETNCYKDH